MSLVSIYYALLMFFLLLLVVKPDSVTSYGGRKTGQQKNLLRKRNNVDVTSEKNENNQHGSSQEVVEVANGEGNTDKIASSGSSASGDEDVFDGSGVLDVELASGSGDDSSDTETQKENAEIKLNGKRLHSISEAITKLLNSGRRRLDILKNGKYSDIKKKSSGPVVHAYVSDNHYDDYEDPVSSKLYRKNVLHHSKHHRPHYYRRRRLPSALDYAQMPYNMFSEIPMDYNEDVPKLPAYKKPMYLYYPEMLPHRYDTIPQQYPEELTENVQPEAMERAILSNYALQQEFAGKKKEESVDI